MVFDLDDVSLTTGAHPWGGDASTQQGCAMEWASFLGGEPWSDRPACVSSLLASFVRRWNDDLGDEQRQRLRPLVARLPGTAGSVEQEEQRSWMLVDWIVRVHCPAWIRLADLDNEADELANLPEFDGPGRWTHADPVIAQVAVTTLGLKQRQRVEARAQLKDLAAQDSAPVHVREIDLGLAWMSAWDNAREVTWEPAVESARPAARGAVQASSWGAGVDTALNAAWDCMRDVAWRAARGAAAPQAQAGHTAEAGAIGRKAASAALWPTAEPIRDSAFALLDRLASV